MHIYLPPTFAYVYIYHIDRKDLEYNKGLVNPSRNSGKLKPNQNKPERNKYLVYYIGMDEELKLDCFGE